MIQPIKCKYCGYDLRNSEVNFYLAAIGPNIARVAVLCLCDRVWRIIKPYKIGEDPDDEWVVDGEIPIEPKEIIVLRNNVSQVFKCSIIKKSNA